MKLAEFATKTTRPWYWNW